MSHDIVIKMLNARAFAPFGEVIELGPKPTMMINRGRCARHHDLAQLDFLDSGGKAQAGISLFDGTPYSLPHTLDMVERHPLGSQAFLPMSTDPFLVIVAPDENGKPGTPLAWLSNGQQGVNYHRNTWHGVLTPIGRQATFAVVDRIGEGVNLEEYEYEHAWRIIDRDGLVKLPGSSADNRNSAP